LRGKASEIYFRWERDIGCMVSGWAPGFSSFPGGMPGDIGLFLAWAQ